MGFEDEMEDSGTAPVNAPVFCPSCNAKLVEGETGNRVCSTNFPPCCYAYWNAKEKKHYWKEGYGPADVYNPDRKVWEKREPTEKMEVRT